MNLLLSVHLHNFSRLPLNCYTSCTKVFKPRKNLAETAELQPGPATGHWRMGIPGPAEVRGQSSRRKHGASAGFAGPRTWEPVGAFWRLRFRWLDPSLRPRLQKFSLGFKKARACRGSWEGVRCTPNEVITVEQLSFNFQQGTSLILRWRSTAQAMCPPP